MIIKLYIINQYIQSYIQQLCLELLDFQSSLLLLSSEI